MEQKEWEQNPPLGNTTAVTLAGKARPRMLVKDRSMMRSQIFTLSRFFSSKFMVEKPHRHHSAGYHSSDHRRWDTAAWQGTRKSPPPRCVTSPKVRTYPTNLTRGTIYTGTSPYSSEVKVIRKDRTWEYGMRRMIPKTDSSGKTDKVIVRSLANSLNGY